VARPLGLGSKSVRSGLVEYAVRTAVNSGSKLVIFVLGTTHSHDFVVVIGPLWMAVAYLLGQYVVSQLVGGVGRKPSHDAQ
jgi:hypothetical protein